MIVTKADRDTRNNYKMLLDAKPIKGFEDLYMITTDGRVFSLRQYCFMETWKDTKGYEILYLKDNDGIKHIKKIHRLVAEHHIPNPDNLPQVNHKDENKSNNSVDNLEWCTNKYNSNYGTRNNRISDNHRHIHKKHWVPVLMYDLEGNFIMELPNMSCAVEYGIPQSNISKVLSGERKSAGGYIFKRKGDCKSALS